MNSKTMTAIALVAILAVAAVGAGFAYSAYTSNSGNSTDAEWVKIGVFKNTDASFASESDDWKTTAAIPGKDIWYNTVTSGTESTVTTEYTVCDQFGIPADFEITDGATYVKLANSADAGVTNPDGYGVIISGFGDFLKNNNQGTKKYTIVAKLIGAEATPQADIVGTVDFDKGYISFGGVPVDNVYKLSLRVSGTSETAPAPLADNTTLAFTASPTPSHTLTPTWANITSITVSGVTYTEGASITIPAGANVSIVTSSGYAPLVSGKQVVITGSGTEYTLIMPSSDVALSAAATHTVTITWTNLVSVTVWGTTYTSGGPLTVSAGSQIFVIAKSGFKPTDGTTPGTNTDKIFTLGNSDITISGTE